MFNIEKIIDQRFRNALEIAVRAGIDPAYRASREVEKWARHIGRDAAKIQGEQKIEFLGVLAGRLKVDADGRQDQSSAATEAVRSCQKSAERIRDIAALNSLGGNATHH